MVLPQTDKSGQSSDPGHILANGHGIPHLAAAGDDSLTGGAISTAVRTPFPPIADYAFLSDCENTCLISSAGSVEWMCVPRPDSPASSARSWTAVPATSAWRPTG